MATSSFDETFIVRDSDAIQRFFEVYYGVDGIIIKNLEEKLQELEKEAKEGIAILKRNIEGKK